MRRVLFALVLVLVVLVGSFGSLNAAPAQTPAAIPSLSSSEDGHQPWVESIRQTYLARFEKMCVRCSKYGAVEMDIFWYGTTGDVWIYWQATDEDIVSNQPSRLPNIQLPSDAVYWDVWYYRHRNWNNEEGEGRKGFTNLQFVSVLFEITPEDLG